MKRLVFLALFLILCAASQAQNLDLVVTAKGDSLACKIDNITDSAISLQIKTRGNENWLQTMYNKTDISSWVYGWIDPSEYDFINGDSRINSSAQKFYPDKFPGKTHLQNAPANELDFYLRMASRTKKRGALLMASGLVVFGSGFFLAITAYSGGGSSGMFSFGLITMVAGPVLTLAGLPVLITGVSRANSINKIKQSQGLSFEFKPYHSNDQQTLNSHSGIKLTLRF